MFLSCAPVQTNEYIHVVLLSALDCQLSLCVHLFMTTYVRDRDMFCISEASPRVLQIVLQLHHAEKNTMFPSKINLQKHHQYPPISFISCFRLPHYVIRIHISIYIYMGSPRFGGPLGHNNTIL